MGKLKLTKAHLSGIRVEITWTTDRGSENNVSLWVGNEGINVSATGTLNAEGVAALEQALAVAKVIYANGLETE